MRSKIFKFSLICCGVIVFHVSILFDLLRNPGVLLSGIGRIQIVGAAVGIGFVLIGIYSSYVKKVVLGEIIGVSKKSLLLKILAVSWLFAILGLSLLKPIWPTSSFLDPLINALAGLPFLCATFFSLGMLSIIVGLRHSNFRSRWVLSLLGVSLPGIYLALTSGQFLPTLTFLFLLFFAFTLGCACLYVIKYQYQSLLQTILLSLAVGIGLQAILILILGLLGGLYFQPVCPCLLRYDKPHKSYCCCHTNKITYLRSPGNLLKTL